MAIGVPITSLGTPVPLRKHALSVQLPKWKDVVGVGNNETKTISALRNGYPRSILHLDIQNVRHSLTWEIYMSKPSILDQIAEKCIQKISACSQDKCDLSLFPDPASAAACKAYMTSVQIQSVEAVPSNDVRMLTVNFDEDSISNHDCRRQRLAPLCAILYPKSARAAAASFWRLTGTGISSRLAEAYLPLANLIRCSEVSGPFDIPYRCPSAPVYHTLRQRIANILARATTRAASLNRVSPSDVFLFPSGMSSIYHVHRMLLQWRDAESVLLGFSYELTLKILQTYGPSCKFFSAGSSEDIDELERYLSKTTSNGTRSCDVQAIWCECPSNPLLWTTDLQRVRRLADKYDLVVVVDDTIASSANVDVLDVADIVVTSLTKSFSGYADVLAGSATLNPDSRHYKDLKRFLNASYVNTLYIDDAIQLEINSRTFLARVAITNETAEYLVDHLRPMESDCTHTANAPVRPGGQLISAIHFPKGSPSMGHYTRQMRRATAEFKPGYGCLFTIEFRAVDMAARFFDSLDLHKGPSLGADVTLVLPYVQLVLQQEKEWAASHGLRETIVRISVGLEDKHDLLERLRQALAVACT